MGCNPQTDWFFDDKGNCDGSRKTAYNNWCGKSDVILRMSSNGECTTTTTTTTTVVLFEPCPELGEAGSALCPEGCVFVENCEQCKLCNKIWPQAKFSMKGGQTTVVLVQQVVSETE